jgi:hypothetical protein
MPRRAEDIVRLDGEEEGGRILGEAAPAGDWELPPRDNRTVLLHYALVLAVGGLVIVLALFYRHLKK